jgi:hypothetical protein
LTVFPKQNNAMSDLQFDECSASGQAWLSPWLLDILGIVSSLLSTRVSLQRLRSILRKEDGIRALSSRGAIHILDGLAARFYGSVRRRGSQPSSVNSSWAITEL